MTENPFTNRDGENLLLIVLTDTAKQAMQRMGIDVGDLQDDLDNLDHIDLFKLPDKKNRGEHLAALPVKDGEYMLFLTFDVANDENYFVCIGIDTNRTHPREDARYCHRLDGVRCVFPYTENGVRQTYQENAVQHDKIFAEVAEKECWRPYESSNIEEHKWRTYLKLYKKILEEKKVSFRINEITMQNDKLCAQLDGVDEGDLEKIKDAEGEEVRFSLLENTSDEDAKKLGKLVSVRQDGNLVVELDKSFENSLKALLVASHGENEQNGSAEDLAEKPVHAGKKKKDAMPQRMLLFADFVGGLYQISVMERSLEKMRHLPVWQVLSGERVAKLPEPADVLGSERGRMNEEQKAAVNGALNAPELFLIWGPPGTGKTEVIMEIAKQEALRGGKTLICSQANLAVDNALARLYGEAHVYPFRIAKEDYELEGEDKKKVPFADSAGRFFLAELQKKLENAPSTEDASIRGLRAQFLTRVETAQKTYEKKKKSDLDREELRQHAALYRQNINVVGTTLMGAGKKNEIQRATGREAQFDTVIIDEVSKATPPELFIPVSLGKRLVLVGDHKQLPPMFEMISGDHRTQEEWASEVGIPVSELDADNTIFERLWEHHKGDASAVRAMLTKQYRMHPDIQTLIKRFYTDSEGTLSFGFGDDRAEIAKLTLQNVDFCRKHRPVMWVGTKSDALEYRVGTSFMNSDEVKKVGKLLDILAASGDRDMSVGVITFYGAQLRGLRKKYEKPEYTRKFGDGKLTFGTVDRFQGRECDVIICSLVRNNKTRNIGFARKINRINVAFSRAKKALIILGSREQFCYEVANEEARAVYKEIYGECDHPQPKELE
ncbi:MAG: AAA domain-containing protein [Gammaproteobacteria bacterium]